MEARLVPHLLRRQPALPRTLFGVLSGEALASLHSPVLRMQNHRIVELSGTFSPERFGRKYFDYVVPTHQKQAAYYCELGIFVRVTGKRPGRNEKGQINVSGLQIA